MKALLINPTYPERPRGFFFPTGIAFVAASIRSAGHEVQIMDTDMDALREKQIREIIGNSEFDIVGTGGLITAFAHIRWLVDLVKEIKPNIPVMVGGGLASALPEFLFRNSKADIGVRKEGELTAVDIMNHLAQGRGLKELDRIPGIFYRGPNGEMINSPERPENNELDKLPFPAWDLFKMDRYISNMKTVSFARTLPVLATRSCPYQCTFCYHTVGVEYRTRTPDNVIDEILAFKATYNITAVQFLDEMFALNKKWVIRFCERYMERDVQLPWNCSARVNSADVEMYRWMKKANCVSINYGLESGSDSMLRVMRKGNKSSTAANAIAIAREAGFNPSSSFMVGAIGETPESIQDTVEFIKQNNLYTAGIFFQTPYPGVPIFDWAIENQRIGDMEVFLMRLGNAIKFLVNLTELPKWKLIYLKCKAEREIRAFFIKNNPAQVISVASRSDDQTAIQFQCVFATCRKTFEVSFDGFFNLVFCPHCFTRYWLTTWALIKAIGPARALRIMNKKICDALSLSPRRMVTKAYSAFMSNFSNSFLAVYLSTTKPVRAFFESGRDKKYWEYI